MINELEVLLGDLHNARGKFSRAVGKFEEQLTPEGVVVFTEIMRGLYQLIDDVDIARMGSGD